MVCRLLRLYNLHISSYPDARLNQFEGLQEPGRTNLHSGINRHLFKTLISLRAL